MGLEYDVDEARSLRSMFTDDANVVIIQVESTEFGFHFGEGNIVCKEGNKLFIVELNEMRSINRGIYNKYWELREQQIKQKYGNIRTK